MIAYLQNTEEGNATMQGRNEQGKLRFLACALGSLRLCVSSPFSFPVKQALEGMISRLIFL
jgi:hypothetical protein